MLDSAAAIDWWTFRNEGDAYLRRLGVSDEVAVMAVARLYLFEHWALRRGLNLTFDPKRFSRPGSWTGIPSEPVLDPRTGKMVPPSIAPGKCQRCGDWCTQTASVCGACWREIRPKKKARRGLQLSSPTSYRRKPAGDGPETYRVTRFHSENSTAGGPDEVAEQVRAHRGEPV